MILEWSKDSFLTGNGKCYLVKKFHASQKHAVIKLISTKGHRKRYIQDWWPISLLDRDVKLISQASAESLKNVLSLIMPSNQNAYVKEK